MIRKTILQSVPSFLLLFVLFLLTTTGCRKSNPAEYSQIDTACREKYNQSYGLSPLQQFDLFLPQGHNQQTKVVVLLHGGGWVSGEKEFVDSYAKYLAGYGYAAISMNYRLACDTVRYNEMLADIGSMIGCILKNASQWGIGRGKLALFGYSAGGHLALLYSYSRDLKQQVAAVVSLAGPTDIQDSLLWKSPGLYDDIKLMTGDPSPAGWTMANPVNFVSSHNPPTFLIHGTNDSVVPVSQSLKLSNVLDASHARVTLLLLENETHYFTSAATGQFLFETKSFLDATMK